MAQSIRKERVIGNPGSRAFSRKVSRGSRRASGVRTNPADIIGFTLANTGRKKGAKVEKKKSNTSHSHHKKPGYAGARHKGNPGHKMNTKHYNSGKKRRNPGNLAGIGPMVVNALFVIVGALGSKLGAQAVLGSNNVGLMGYAANAGAGAVLWFLAEHVMHSHAAAAGVVAGTLVQIILRVINDYTPFGSYVSQLGMGDYQMQSFVTPQVLVDPMRNADIRIPAGWGPAALTAAGAPMVAMAAPAAAAPAAGGPAAPPAQGVSGGLYGGYGGPGLYRAA